MLTKSSAARMFIITASLVLALSIGFSQAAEENNAATKGVKTTAVEMRCQIEVHPYVCFVYGHQISEDGLVELVCLDGKVFMDGWQVHPVLQLKDYEEFPLRGGYAPATSPKTALTQGIYMLRDSLFAANESVETIVPRLVKILEDSDLVVSVAKTSEVGRYWTVQFKGRDWETLMPLGENRPPITLEELIAIRNSSAIGSYNRMVKSLNAGNMVIVSANPMPVTALIPQANIKDIIPWIKEAQNFTQEISLENWPTESEIGYVEATQLKTPLPLNRRKGE